MNCIDNVVASQSLQIVASDEIGLCVLEVAAALERF